MCGTDIYTGDPERRPKRDGDIDRIILKELGLSHGWI